MSNQQPRTIKFGKVAYLSSDKGAFVAEVSWDQKVDQKLKEIFVSNEVLQSLKEQNRKLRKGQLVQFEMEENVVKAIKSL